MDRLNYRVMLEFALGSFIIEDQDPICDPRSLCLVQVTGVVRIPNEPSKCRAVYVLAFKICLCRSLFKQFVFRVEDGV